MDFDLVDTAAHEITAVGVNVTSRDKNRVIFDVVDSAFELKVDGFSTNMRLRCRLRYPEQALPTSTMEPAEADETEGLENGSTDND